MIMIMIAMFVLTIQPVNEHRHRCKQTLLLEIEVRQEMLILNYYI